MKRATDLVLVAALTITCALSNAQDDSPSTRPANNSIHLVLILGNREGALATEETLTIRMSNEGNASVSFPEPGQLCGDSLDGFVMVYKKILSRSANVQLGRGCVVDKVARTDVLAEAKKCKTLAPKEVYEFTVSLRGALLLNANGRYELTAKYYPPHLTSAELSLLTANGITVVQETLESLPLLVEPR
jgi:hypothetical protein